jgi:hypothetical protein
VDDPTSGHRIYETSGYRRQKCGVKMISTVTISNRPIGMVKVQTQV